MGGFHGMLLFSATRSRLLVGRENTLRKASRRTIQRTNHSVWFDGRISPYFYQRPVATASVRHESLSRNFPRWNLERRHCGRRHWGIGKDGRILNPCWETQCKGSANAHEWWKVYIPDRRWNGKTLWRRSGSENVHLKPGQVNLLEEPDGSSPPLQDSHLDAGEAIYELLVYLRRFHLPSSCGTPSQTVRADRRIIPNSTEIYWRYKNNQHNFGSDVGEGLNQLSEVDHVPTNTRSSQGESQLYIFEDNEAVIKMSIEGRSPTMRQVSRTHRVALDRLFHRINLGPKDSNQIRRHQPTTRRHTDQGQLHMWWVEQSSPSHQ